MALIDADWWKVRRKLGGATGASQVMSSQPAPTYTKRAPYIRLRPTSIKSSSRRQRDLRARWAHITWAWNNLLTQNDRDDWNDRAGAGSRQWYDALEQYRHLTGYELYCAYNAQAMAAGFALNTDAYEAGYGQPVDALSFTFLDQQTIRITYEPDWYPLHAFVVWFRGPMSPGCHAVVPDVVWPRSTTPTRWRFAYAVPPGHSSPEDLTLPVVVPSGRKVAITAAFMNPAGGLPDEWPVAQEVRP